MKLIIFFIGTEYLYVCAKTRSFFIASLGSASGRRRAVDSFPYPSSGTPYARITQDGTLLYEINLDTVETPYFLQITDEAGAYNQIEVSHKETNPYVAGKLPDQICIHTGWIETDALPIVCLPNRIVIEIFYSKEVYSMNSNIRRTALLGLFTAVALALYLAESLLPPPLPVAGVRLGLANVVTLILLIYNRPKDALAVLLARILLGSIFAGQMLSFLYRPMRRARLLFYHGRTFPSIKGTLYSTNQYLRGSDT